MTGEEESKRRRRHDTDDKSANSSAAEKYVLQTMCFVVYQARYLIFSGKVAWICNALLEENIHKYIFELNFYNYSQFEINQYLQVY